MDQERAVKRMMLDVKVNLDEKIPEELHAVVPYLYPLFRYYLGIMYVVGWEDNRVNQLGHGKKPIGQYRKDGTLLNVFRSRLDAAKKTGFTENHISKMVRNESESRQGWFWKYI
ncbi:MAG: hypothetical protein ABSA76_01245 [Bacteroidales bacterium]